MTSSHRVTRRSHGQRSAVRATSQNQDKLIDPRDPSHEDKPGDVSDVSHILTAPTTTAALSTTIPTRNDATCDSSPHIQQAPPVLAQSPQIHGSELCTDPCSLLPLPAGRRRVGGRLGVSFCFSRRGPKLEPCASVFSDLEEDDIYKKKEQMRERIRCFLKDIEREIGTREEQNSDSVGLSSMGPVPRESASEDSEIEKRDLEKEQSATSTEAQDNQSHDSLFLPACGEGPAEAYMGPQCMATIKSEAEDSQYVCVLGKDGTTQLRWPTSSLKFTKYTPHISFSCNPRYHKQPQEKQEGHNQLLYSGNPKQAESHLMHTQEQTGEALKSWLIPGKTEEYVFSKEKTPTPTAEKQTQSVGNCTVPMVFSCDHKMDGFDTNTQNTRAGRLGVTTVGDITSLSCKLECVTKRTCTRPSRCESKSETICSDAMQENVGVAKVSRKKRTSTIRKHRTDKQSRQRSDKISNRRKMCKVRSVVSTVSACKAGSEEDWEERQSVGEGSRCLQGTCERTPGSVSVRSRRPRRSSEQHLRHRHDEYREEGHSATAPWRSHFSPRSDSKMFWERGHHSNPRSFIDCCYPDNSSGNSPARKRKLLHRDRKSIHSKKKKLRHCEEVRGRKLRDSCDRGVVSDTEQWEWMSGADPRGSEDCTTAVRWRSEDKFEEWHATRRSSPSPSGWRQRGGSTEEGDWDRWTCGSTDSWEDRGTSRSDSRRDSPGCTRFWGNRACSSRHMSSPDWWTNRQVTSPGSVSMMSRVSPRSCSPCSTTLSELSWEWSRSSTCSGISMDKLTVSSGKLLTPASVNAPLETQSISSPTSTTSSLSFGSCPSSSPQRPPLTVHNVSTPLCELNETHSQVAASPDTDRSSCTILPGLCTQTLSLKTAKTMHLPLIGKLPAIQRKARLKRCLVDRGKDKEADETEEVAKAVEKESGAEVNNQDTSHELSTSSSLKLRASDTPTAVEAAPPVSFSADEMDKYRLLQEQAREHMQKVLEQISDAAETTTDTKYSDCERPEERGATGDQYSPVQQPLALHTELIQTQAQHTLQLPLPLPPENYTQTIPLNVPPLPPMPSSPPMPNLHHILLPLPPSSSASHSASSPPAPPLHPLSLHHIPPHGPPPIHLPPLSISSLFPSVLLSHRPIPLLHPSMSFHTTTLSPLSPLTLQPLAPQPFLDRAWTLRFPQKAL